MRWPIDKPVPRSYLFVPGNSPEKLHKSWQLSPGALIFDVEDAVPESQKLQARQNISLALKAAPKHTPYVFVRINDLSTRHWQDDISAATCKNLSGFFLPKCESSGEVSVVADFIADCEKRTGLYSGSISLVVMIESALGLIKIPQIVTATERLVGLALGGEDFCLNMGISRTVEGLELLYARSRLAIWARAHGFLAIDTIYADFNDSQGLMLESRIAKQLGFTGKLAVYPGQLEPINAAFSPSEKELKEAEKVVEAFEAAQNLGRGVTVFNGKMIDRPIVEWARRLLASTGNR